MEDRMAVSMKFTKFPKPGFLKINKARRVTATLLSLTLGVVAVFNTSPTIAAKKQQDPNAVGAKTGNQQVGQLIAVGGVTVNEKRAITGTSIFPDNRIAVDCAKGSRAIVDLGKLGRIELIEGS